MEIKPHNILCFKLKKQNKKGGTRCQLKFGPSSERLESTAGVSVLHLADYMGQCWPCILDVKEPTQP